MTFYPAFLDLRGRRTVVVGGGAIAEQKVLGLIAAGARVTMVSPAVTLRLRDLAHQGDVELRERPYRPGDLAGAFLAIAATDDGAVNEAVWAEAEQRGILLNAVDDLPHCSFIAPSVHRRGDVTVAVSTAGKSPALAVRLRERIGRAIGPEYAAFAEMLGALRPAVAARVPDPRARLELWYRIVDSNVVELLRRGDRDGAERRVAQLIDAAGAGEPGGPLPGAVYIVGAGPGDPDLITVRGLEVLGTADLVVYDRLVHQDLVDRAPPWAERVFVGKRSGQPGTPRHLVEQEDINALLIARARAGRTVVRLKGGDPYVFGRGAEEGEALRAAGVPFQVIPGVTSAVAAPGAAGIPVTHRRHGSAFAVVAGHECDGPSDLDWEALARIPTLVFLMGVRALSGIADRLLAHGMPAARPAAVVASATLPDERTIVGTIGTIARLARDTGLEPPATLIVGAVVHVRETLAGRPEQPGALEGAATEGAPR
ncbi:MAG TPA: siroheme synthase CysG [Gemmatimonadales bacterium]|jgi:uroporphyrin-III C-methyltransferase/precorrin-2 dehydrogenase/sirohydrochlorin ferrochelatase|nr:siroheme synthase CysG [Gemmatimonadales bacterium]